MNKNMKKMETKEFVVIPKKDFLNLMEDRFALKLSLSQIVDLHNTEERLRRSHRAYLDVRDELKEVCEDSEELLDIIEDMELTNPFYGCLANLFQMDE